MRRARSQALRTVQDGPRHHHARWSRRFTDALHRTHTSLGQWRTKPSLIGNNPNPVLGCMQDDAELMNEIVADAYRRRPGRSMIAAIALHHGLELVTGNTAHFQRVQQIGP